MNKLIATLFVTALMIGWLAASPSPAPEAAPVASEAEGARTMVLATPKDRNEPAGNGQADVALTRAPDGHFYADAQVNGATIRFLVDTGATTVALTPEDAQAAGLQFSDDEFTATGHAASGTIAFKPVQHDRVALGPVEARDVDAVIARADMGISLLGQSWLRRVGTVTIEGDRMVLR